METILKKMDLEFCGTGKHKINPDKFLEQSGAIFLDVRATEEVKTIGFNFSYFGIKVINIPIEELSERFDELPKDVLIGTFCCSGTRSVIAYAFLLSKGYDKVKWIDAGLEQLTALLKPGLIYKKSINK